MNGLRASDRIVVASFHSPYVCRRFRRALLAAGVEPEVEKDGGRWVVAVRYGDRDIAHELVAHQRSEYPDHRPRVSRGAFDFTMLGGVAGAVAGVTSMSLPTTPWMRVIIWAGFVGTGIVLGCVADRFQRSYRYLGSLQFDLIDFIWLISAAALTLSFWIGLARLV